MTLIDREKLISELKSARRRGRDSAAQSFPHDQAQWTGVDQGLEAAIQLAKKAKEVKP